MVSCVECENLALKDDYLCGIHRDATSGFPIIKDILGRELHVEDYVCWAIQTGSSAGLAFGEILSISRNTSSDSYKFPFKATVAPIKSTSRTHYWELSRGGEQRTVTIKKVQGMIKVDPLDIIDKNEDSIDV